MRILLKVGIFLIFLLIILLLGQVIFERTYFFPSKIKYGVTFSPKFASELNLDWKDTYVKVLDDLKVRNLRIPTYWDDDLSKVDFMLSEASKRQAKVILTLGMRQPRWPECHIPIWAQSLSVKDKQIKLLEYITNVVQKYESDFSIEYWQVENEPLLGVFGQCDDPDEKFLIREVALVRSLSKKPIIVTDSGELGFWVTPMKLSDTFGTTLYRKVYNPILGYTSYPILPYLYDIKSKLAGGKKTIIVELQAEPWSPDNSLAVTDVEKQTRIFSLNEFKNYINYAKATGFSENYLWGVEWWYFMAKMGHPEYLEYANTLFDKK